MALDFDWSAAIDAQNAAPAPEAPTGLGVLPFLPAPYLGGGFENPGLEGQMPGQGVAEGMNPYLGRMENTAMQYAQLVGDMGGFGAPMSGMLGAPTAPARRRRPELFTGLQGAMRRANRFRDRRMGNWMMDPGLDFLSGIQPIRDWTDQVARGRNPWEPRRESPPPPPAPMPERPSWQDRRRMDRGQWY
jgi:hypothetical protein